MKRPKGRFDRYTPLTRGQEEILSVAQNKGIVTWPRKMTSAPQKRDKDKYCRFHRDHGHDTSKCFQLKDYIENLIRDENLKEFIVRRDDDNTQRQRRGSTDKRPKRRR
ncbi:hypothetical protein ACOSP7_010627 [Xanthoceras sorbifolium]